MAHVGNQLSPKLVGLAQLAHLQNHPLGHSLEGGDQPADLVTGGVPNTGPDHARIGEITVPKSLRRPRQTSQATGHAVEEEEAGEQGHQKGAAPDGQAEAQEVISAQQLDRRVVLLTGQDHVQVALVPVLHHDGGDREHLAAGEISRVVTDDGELGPLCEKGLDGRHRNAIAPQLAGRRRMGHHLAVHVEQVDLDVGIDEHQGPEHVLQGGLVDLAVHQEHVLPDQIGCQRPVDPLDHFLFVALGGVDRDQQEDRSKE